MKSPTWLAERSRDKGSSRLLFLWARLQRHVLESRSIQPRSFWTCSIVGDPRGLGRDPPIPIGQ